MITVEEFRLEAQAFLEASTASGAACKAYGAIVPPEVFEPAKAWQRYCTEHGFAGIHWPERYGGRGLTLEHSAAWFEACALAGIAGHLNIQGMTLAAGAIMRSGTDEQKERFLRATLTTDIVWCQLFSEPDAGSDLAGLQATAVLDGDHFVLNGQKVWSSNAQFAQFGILMARTDPEASKHKGISFFLIDMTLPGVEVRTIKQMTGAEEFCEVFFTDALMPADALLGPLHGGWGVAMDVLIDERGAFGGASIISLERRLKRLINQYDDLDAIGRNQLAGYYAQGQALKALLSRGDDPGLAPAAKLGRSELDPNLDGLNAQLRGAASMIWNESTDAFLYSPGMRIAGGSSEIQRNILGERVLGLPREPR